jgi:hypothetical protein
MGSLYFLAYYAGALGFKESLDGQGRRTYCNLDFRKWARRRKRDRNCIAGIARRQEFGLLAWFRRTVHLPIIIDEGERERVKA